MQSPVPPTLAPDIQRDIEAVARIEAVPTLLKVLCEHTGMGFAAVARVTDTKWTACAVEDQIDFGLKPGGELAIDTTLCKEVRATRVGIVIDQATTDPVYRTHHTPRLYNIESYISVPIVLPGGEYFGNLCAIDPRPARVSDPRTVSMFERFAGLIAGQLDSVRRRDHAEEALQAERDEAGLREQFIAILGHDLRNPLAAVAMSSEVLLRASGDERLVRDMASRIRNHSRRMATLISDMLDLARGRLGGGIGLDFTELTDLARSLENVAREIRDGNPGRAIESRIAVSRPVIGDGGRLQQLVSNLLGNAITHGAADSPIRFEVFDTEQALTIRVWNQGNPIPPEQLPKIMGPFWRKATAENREGLGLGLYICSEIVKAHHGTLTVTSSAEAGTEFVAEIPLRVAG